MGPLRRKPKNAMMRRGISMLVILIALAALLLMSFTVLGLYLYISQAPSPTEQLDTALRLFNKGDVDVAARIAGSLDDKVLEKNSEHSKKHFLIGVQKRISAKSIEQLPVALERNAAAVEHLEKSKSYSFPAGYEGVANYHLGMALFDLFRWQDAAKPLMIASERWPQGRSDSIERLVDIDLSRDHRNLESAQTRIDHWRTLPRSSPLDDERADVKQMQVQLASEHWDAIPDLQQRIDIDSPNRPLADLIAARALLQKSLLAAEGPERERLRDQAGELWMGILKSPKTPVVVRRQANLDLGKLQRMQGKLRDATSTFSILRLSSPFEPESLAAGVEEIETLMESDRIEDSLATLHYITSNFGERPWYQTDWLPIEEVREKIVKAAHWLIDHQHFEAASRFLEDLPKFCQALDHVRLSSKLYEQWAESLPDSLNGNPKKQKYYKAAADAYSKLLRSLPRDAEFDDWLWRSIEDYRKAGAFNESNLMVDRFLSLESRSNRPRGYFVRAKNLNALERKEEAMQALEQILFNNPNSPLAYEARLELAKMRSQRDEFDAAQDLMLENLSGELRPESAIWRESLYELGMLLYSRGEKQLLASKNEIEANPSKARDQLSKIDDSFQLLEKSIGRNEVFLRLYPTDMRRFSLLYQLAKSYQLSAYWPFIQMQQAPTMNEDRLLALKAQRKELLLQARKSFARLRQEILNDRNATRSTVNNIDDLLRNSYFGEADLFFDEEDYEQALVAYTDAANRFINEPESLEARKQIALCQMKLGRIADSRRSLELARDSLQRIPAEMDDKFKRVTPHDRAGWDRYLSSLLSNLPANN